MKCVQKAWNNHQPELRDFFRGRLGEVHWADDLLQDVFVKALANRETFCQLTNTRAWLYRVAKNRLIDFQRSHKYYTEVSDYYPVEIYEPSPLENLSKCLLPVLKNLSADDQDIIEWCDLEGLHQAEYARLKDLSIVAAKSRIQRARKRLKNRLLTGYQIGFDEHGAVCCFASNS